MPKLTKGQAKRLLKSMDSKAKKLWAADVSWAPRMGGIMSTPDMITIEKIVGKYLKKLG